MSGFEISAAVRVDKGRVRMNNEDNFYFGGQYLAAEDRDKPAAFFHTIREGSALYGVFDGMGGEEFGEEASMIAAQETERLGSKFFDEGAAFDKTALDVVQAANDGICGKITEHGVRRIGATYSLLKISDKEAEVCNVGDSRVYMLRGGRLRQISVDDTSAQHLVNMGIITAREARTHVGKHKLTQHLGMFPDEIKIEPHFSGKIPLKKGDVFLLCSDGLTDMVEDREIKCILKDKKDCNSAAEALMDTALNNGGKDNVTIMVVRVDKCRSTAKQSCRQILKKIFRGENDDHKTDS